MRWLLVLLILAGCDSFDTPLPERCRAVGVAVQDSDIITGSIVSENVADLETVSIQCASPFKPKSGCAIPVNDGEYVLWFIDDPAIRDHERCHSLYEERKHTKDSE